MGRILAYAPGDLFPAIPFPALSAGREDMTTDLWAIFFLPFRMLLLLCLSKNSRV